MARIQPPPPETAPERGPVLEASKNRMECLPNSQRIMASRPEILRALVQLAAAISGPSWTIDPQLRCLVSQMGRRASGFGHCMARTAHTAGRVGISAARQICCGNTRRARW